MRRLRSDEGGWALVSSVLLLGICGAIGMASLSTVDAEQRESGVIRTRDASFTLSEGVLSAQIFRLSQRWPGKGADGRNPAYGPYPTCDQTSTSTDCPQPQAIGQFFATDPATGSVDLRNATWRTSVHDNQSPSLNYYDDAETLASSAQGYDANGDGRLWVRAQAIARAGGTQGRTRTLIALVRIDTRQEDVPRSALLAGSLDMTNQGNKVIIDAMGDGAAPALVAVRCDKDQPNTLCIGHTSEELQAKPRLAEQINPPHVIQDDYGLEPAMSPDAVARLRARAIADGTYYTSCPADPAGAVVWIDSGDCAYKGNTVINSEESPGIIIQRTGTLAFGGGTKYHGVVYHLNEQQTTGTVVRIYGQATVYGGVIVEGLAGVEAGSDKQNIHVKERAFSSVRSYTTAGIIQNTWREIRPAQ